jgi:hypothetical protein
MSSAPLLLACLGCAGLLLATSGCESTQSKSQKLSKTAQKSVANQKGLTIGRRSTAVKVVETKVLADANGTAAVVVVRNTTHRALPRVPIAIDVTGAGGKSMFKNDDPGLEPSLTGLPTMAPGQTVAWVDDQVFADKRARDVRAEVGAGAGRPPARLPAVKVGPAKLGGDPTSGVAAEGSVTNDSKLEQRKLVLFAVARKGGQIVAAGRGQVEKLRVGKTAKYQIFFIGNPRGAQIEVVAPPTRTS